MAKASPPTVHRYAFRAGVEPGGAIGRPPKPVKSVGRDRARLYCPSCGRKRSVCHCEVDADREALTMAQIEARFRIS